MNYFREAKIDILINETKSTRLPEMMVNGSLLAETRLAGRLAYQSPASETSPGRAKLLLSR